MFADLEMVFVFSISEIIQSGHFGQVTSYIEMYAGEGNCTMKIKKASSSNNDERFCDFL